MASRRQASRSAAARKQTAPAEANGTENVTTQPASAASRKRRAARPATTLGALRRRTARSEESTQSTGDPFAVGTRHWVLYREEMPCMAEIVERRTRAATGEPEFYVHYENFDKRLDSWVTAERFLSEDDAQRRLGKSTASVVRSLRRAPAASVAAAVAASSSAAASPLVDPAYAQLEREHEEATRVKNIQRIELGRHVIDCWYFSPYPDEYAQDVDMLYVCQHCLRYMKHRQTYERHWHTCAAAGAPPGRVVYLKDGLAVYEVDGADAKLYCQNLCLLAKLFLDHKTLYYDVSPFIFYVLFEVDASGRALHPVGYFSKEKASADGYNLACIMVLPPYQKRGYGRFLIQLSYEITRREGKTGTPEKPLSDLGRLSYRSFWAHELLVALRRASSSRTVPTIADLSRETGFMREDIVETLMDLGLLRTHRGQSVLNMAPRLIESHLRDLFGSKKFTLLDPESLNWPS